MNRTIQFYYSLFTIGSLIYTPRYRVIRPQEFTHYATHTTDNIRWQVIYIKMIHSKSSHEKNYKSDV